MSVVTVLYDEIHRLRVRIKELEERVEELETYKVIKEHEEIWGDSEDW